MMRIQPKPLNSYPVWLRPFFWNQKRKYGQVLLPGLIWGRVPWLFAAVALMYGVLDRRRSPLEPALRTLVTVRVSQINQCRFCIDINSWMLARRSGSEDKVQAVADWRNSDLFSEEEKTVLEYTEAMTFTGTSVTDDLVERLRTWFDEDAIIELTGLVAFQNLSSKFNAALDIPAQGFCQTPLGKQESPDNDHHNPEDEHPEV